MDMKIAILGVGNMGQALLEGILASGLAPAAVRAFDVDAEKLRALAERGVGTATTAAEAAAGAQLVVLAVKPQTLPELCAGLGEAAPEATWLSIAAGVSTARLEAWLGPQVRVVRAMPNTPALVGQGAAAICPGQRAEAADLERATALLTPVGLVCQVTEAQLDAVTGLSGSGPAYGYIMVEALADAGVAQGLPRPLAQALAAQTLLGAAQMVKTSGLHPGELKDRVCSPGGTTIAGVAALERGGLRATLMAAVAAATARSRELGQG